MKLETPVGDLKTVRVDLPVGLSVNPQATAAVPAGDLRSQRRRSCPSGSERRRQRGDRIALSARRTPPARQTRPSTTSIPPAGEPARFGFNLLGNNVYLRADVAWDGDYHEGFTIDVPETPFESPSLRRRRVLKNRLVFDGRAGNGTFITTPSTCLGPASPPFEHVYSTYLLAGLRTEEEEPGYSSRPARTPLRVADPARHLAEGMRHGPLRALDRRRPGHRADRLAVRRLGRA